MLVHEILAFQAIRTPDRVAVRIDTYAPTFSELNARVGQLASRLSALAERGDRVAIIAENCPAWIDCLYGVPRAGMVLTPINPRLTVGEQAAQLADAGASVLIGARSCIEALAVAASKVPCVAHAVTCDGESWDLFLGAASSYPSETDASGRHETAWMIFTSGTTGKPKAAMLTHSSLLAAVIANALGRPVCREDVYISAYPLYHISAMNVLVYHFHGCPVVLLPRFDPIAFASAVTEFGATTTTMAPTMLVRLLDHLESGGHALPTLRRIGYGAAPMTQRTLARASAALDVVFTESYGMTELSGAIVFDGCPSPMTCVRVVDEKGRDVLEGDVGEIVVRGDQVTAGYWNAADLTAASVRGGWFYTGDLGSWDPAGGLRVVGRTKDVVITGGENVMAREVENAVQDHPGVVEVAVAGLPDPDWGEAVTAFVVRRPDCRITEDEIREHAARCLAAFKRPKRVFFLEALPTNPSGKVDKHALRSSYVTVEPGPIGEPADP